MDARRLFLPLVLALLMATRPGVAQPNQAGQSSATHRSIGQAVAIGVGSVVIPTGIGLILANQDSGEAAAALLLTSWIVGPSPGLFYAGNDKRAWDGMAFRALTLAIGAGGVAIMAANFNLFDDSNDGGFAAGVMISLAAAGLTVGSWIRDIREIPPSVERFNAGLEAAPLLTLDGRVGAQLSFRW